MKKKRFIVSWEEYEEGMIIDANSLDDAREKILMEIDIHEVDNEGEIID